MSQLTEDLIHDYLINLPTFHGPPLADYASEIQDSIDGTIDALLWATSAYSVVADDGTITHDPESDQSFSDLNFDRDDITTESLESVSREVIDFIGGNWADCLAYADARKFDPSKGSIWSYLGHDLALTREGHGAGFWDRGLGELGDRLTEACKPYGGFEMYLGDDGRVYID